MPEQKADDVAWVFGILCGGVLWFAALCGSGLGAETLGVQVFHGVACMVVGGFCGQALLCIAPFVIVCAAIAACRMVVLGK